MMAFESILRISKNAGDFRIILIATARANVCNMQIAELARK